MRVCVCIKLSAWCVRERVSEACVHEGKMLPKKCSVHSTEVCSSVKEIARVRVRESRLIPDCVSGLYV